jgi:hypothetical protein
MKKTTKTWIIVFSTVFILSLNANQLPLLAQSTELMTIADYKRGADQFSSNLTSFRWKLLRQLGQDSPYDDVLTLEGKQKESIRKISKKFEVKFVKISEQIVARQKERNKGKINNGEYEAYKQEKRREILEVYKQFEGQLKEELFDRQYDIFTDDCLTSSFQNLSSRFEKIEWPCVLANELGLNERQLSRLAAITVERLPQFKNAVRQLFADYVSEEKELMREVLLDFKRSSDTDFLEALGPEWESLVFESSSIQCLTGGNASQDDNEKDQHAKLASFSRKEILAAKFSILNRKLNGDKPSSLEFNVEQQFELANAKKRIVERTQEDQKDIESMYKKGESEDAVNKACEELELQLMSDFVEEIELILTREQKLALNREILIARARYLGSKIPKFKSNPALRLTMIASVNAAISGSDDGPSSKIIENSAERFSKLQERYSKKLLEHAKSEKRHVLGALSVDQASEFERLVGKPFEDLLLSRGSLNWSEKL